MDLLESGTEREPRRLLPRPDLPRTVAALLASAAAVAVAGAASVPSLRAQALAESAPPSVTATTSGGSALGGRLRVWLLLEGPPSAPLSAVAGRLPGSVVRTNAPDAFSRRGYAVVRLDVTPACPDAVAGLSSAALELTVGDAGEVRVPVDTDGILAGTVRARCDGEAAQVQVQARGPLVRGADSGVPGLLRTVVELGAPGPEVLVVTGVGAGPGLTAQPLTSLPLRVTSGRRGQLVVDLAAAGCSAGSAAPPFLLEYATEGEVAPRVDPALQDRLDALRRAAC